MELYFHTRSQNYFPSPHTISNHYPLIIKGNHSSLFQYDFYSTMQSDTICSCHTSHRYQSLSQLLSIKLFRQGSKGFGIRDSLPLALNLVSIRHQAVEHIRGHPDGKEAHEFFGAEAFSCSRRGTRAASWHGNRQVFGQWGKHGMFGALSVLVFFTERLFLMLYALRSISYSG